MSTNKIYGECYVCNSELCGTVIEVAGRHYHNRCFYCCKCRKQLGREEFRMRDERFFCIPCYSKTFERICAECNEYITDDKFIEALNGYYHCNHFICFLCKKPFPDSRFVRKEIYYQGEQMTRPFCLDCHRRVKKMKCTTCHNPLGEVKAFDGENFYHDFCWLRDHPDEDESGERMERAAARLQEEEEKRQKIEEERRKKEEEERMKQEEEERKKREEEERMREEEEKRMKQEEEERKQREEEERVKRLEEERIKKEEEKKKREEEKAKREEEERARLEEESRKKDEERKKKEEERKQREEEKAKKEEEERVRKEEEKKKKEEEERIKKEEEEKKKKEEEEERKKQNRREMTELYRTKNRTYDFNDDEDYQPQVESKPQRVVPSVPPAPPKPRYTRSPITEMLSESYAPMKIAPTEQPEEEQTGDVVRSSIFAYPQYDDYRKKNQRSWNSSEDKQMEAIDESDDEDDEKGENDNVDEVPMEASVMKYDGVDEEYVREQKRVKELANDELKIYPLSVLTKQPLPYDVDPSRKEYHLSDEEFEQVFKMSKKMYEQQPKWKRTNMRKKLDLF